jgi:hypothetical protein
MSGDPSEKAIESTDCEEIEAQLLVAAVTQRVQEVFEEAVAEVGIAKAKKIWKEVASNRKRGRPKRYELNSWDTIFLQWYDDEMSLNYNKKTVVGRLARFVHENNEHYQHSTPEALEKRIRWLLKVRQAGRLIPRKNAHGFPIYSLLPSDGN